MENEFPPNSHSKKEPRRERSSEPAPEKKGVERVTKGKVIQRKKPLYQKFIDAFRPEDNKGFFEYVVLEVLIPGVKDNLADAATASIENALGVNGGGARRRRGRGDGGYTSYNRMSTSRRDSRGRDRDRDDDRRPARRSGSDELPQIVLETRVEADEVIDNLFELLSKYEVATKRDLLSLVGEPHSYTDEDWGWTDLRGARVHRVREGYLIDLPRIEPLD